jgi:hypothetical protein
MDVHYCELSSEDRHGKEWSDMFPPQAVDQAISHAISMCWMMLPKDKKNPDAVATEIRRILERALADLKEDAQAFGFAEAPG